MIEVYARIIMRYGVGALVAWGVLSPGTGLDLMHDRDLVLVLAALIGLGVEVWYSRAKKKGRAT